MADFNLDELLDVIERASKENGRKIRYRFVEEEEVRRVRTSVELEAEAKEARLRIREEFTRLQQESQIVRRKLKLPEDASTSTLYGTINVFEHQAHGYRTYVAAYKCEDKQGEIARQAARIAELETQLLLAQQEIELLRRK